MDHARLDGNALGGLFYELFGREMTAELGRCGVCGAVNALGAVHVYMQAPGQVIRCPACSSVLMVITRVSGRLRVNFAAIRWIETAES